MKLSRSFYNHPTLKIAKELLGKYLVRKKDGKKLTGMIVETEAYVGLKDSASHASRGKTKRSEIMFGPPGYGYIYLIYGLNYCLNIVTEKKEYPAAVLIRAVEPEKGKEIMSKNRKLGKEKKDINLTNGPGKFCQAFMIDKELNGIDMTKDVLYIEDRGCKISKKQIVAAKRIGVDYAGEYRDKLWRFYIKNNIFVSKK